MVSAVESAAEGATCWSKQQADPPVSQHDEDRQEPDWTAPLQQHRDGKSGIRPTVTNATMRRMWAPQRIRSPAYRRTPTDARTFAPSILAVPVRVAVVEVGKVWVRVGHWNVLVGVQMGLTGRVSGTVAMLVMVIVDVLVGVELGLRVAMGQKTDLRNRWVLFGRVVRIPQLAKLPSTYSLRHCEVVPSEQVDVLIGQW